MVWMNVLATTGMTVMECGTDLTLNSNNVNHLIYPTLDDRCLVKDNTNNTTVLLIFTSLAPLLNCD